MTIFYQITKVEGSLFLRGQVVNYKIDNAEPVWATKDRLERLLHRKYVEKVWFET